MIRSIRAKFTLWYIGSFFLLILIAMVITVLVFEIVAIRDIDQGLYEGAKILEQALSACFPIERYEQAEELNECFDKTLRELFFDTIVFAQLASAAEKEERSALILARSYTLRNYSLPVSPEVYQGLQTGTPVFETVGDKAFEFAEIRMISIPIHPNDIQSYFLQLGVSLGQEKNPSVLQPFLATRPHIFMIIFPFLLIMTGFLGYFFMKRAFAPVHTIVTLAKNITAEDLSHRIETVKSNDEIGELADTFNEMIARLDRSFKQIQQFSGDVSHELKTPLTVIKGEIEIALRKERTKEEYQEILKSLSEETGKLNKIVEDLLFLSRMDAHTIPLSFTELAMDELLLEVYENTYRLAQQKQIALNLNNVEQVTVMGDPGLLKRVLNNLVLNAIKYTPEGGKIDLFLRQNSDRAIWTISDTGVGIPEESMPYIFDRFYRVDQSRSHETGGSGLGLAIVQKIVEAHQGKIEVRSKVGEGTTFRVVLNRIV